MAITADGLYDIDIGTGLPTNGRQFNNRMHDIEWSSADGLVGVDSSRMFSIDGYWGIDLATAELTLLGAIFLHETAASAFAVDQESGLFFFGSVLYPERLARWRLSESAAEPVGEVIPPFRDITFDVENTLYGITEDDLLLRIDKTDGTVLSEIALSMPVSFPSLRPDGGMSFHPESNLLYVSNGTTLFRVDPNTGGTVEIGSTGMTITGLAFVPEPSALFLMLFGLNLAYRRCRTAATANVR